MNGIELKKLLKLNYLSQEDAAELFNVKRETVNRWCSSEKDLPEKTHKLVMSKLRITDPNFSLFNENGVQVVGENSGNIDNRQYYSDSPDVLRAQIDLLDERIKEKDAQIKEKDAQIKEKDAQIARLLGVIEKMSEGVSAQK